ncbi:hypothetical protein DEJ15_07700 [Curtobacterium sp. MCJR17_043]|nr:hypothetical protein [Curtobacterium sp. MCJR17_043]WIB36864.1 hypothetical protein DEJ15_07700 [Curtobacterium sp. MCJR17_043]
MVRSDGGVTAGRVPGRRPSRLRSLSLRARITIGSTVIAAVVIALLVLVMRLQVVNVVASATETLLDADTDPYVATLEVDSDPNLSPPGNAQFVAVVSPTGEITLSSMPRRLEQSLGSLRTTPAGTSVVELGGSQYRVVVEHPVNQAGRWTVVAARNSQAEAIVVDELTTTLSFTGLAILLAFGVASWVLATTALRPVNRMRREAERLSVAPRTCRVAGRPGAGRTRLARDDPQRLPGADATGHRTRTTDGLGREPRAPHTAGDPHHAARPRRARPGRRPRTRRAHRAGEEQRRPALTTGQRPAHALADRGVGAPRGRRCPAVRHDLVGPR